MRMQLKSFSGSDLRVGRAKFCNTSRGVPSLITQKPEKPKGISLRNSYDNVLHERTRRSWGLGRWDLALEKISSRTGRNMPYRKGFPNAHRSTEHLRNPCQPLENSIPTSRTNADRPQVYFGGLEAKWPFPGLRKNETSFW